MSEAFFNIFAEKVQYHGTNNTPKETEKDEDIRYNEEKSKEKAKTRSAKDVTARDATVGITGN